MTSKVERQVFGAFVCFSDQKSAIALIASEMLKNSSMSDAEVSFSKMPRRTAKEIVSFLALVGYREQFFAREICAEAVQRLAWLSAVILESEACW